MPHVKKSTMADVARTAGVALKTVSRVVNGGPNVSAEVRVRVQTAIAALNYHPNAFAQGLVRQRSHLIGLVYENPSASYVVDLQRGVLDRLDGSHYRLVVMPVRSVEKHVDEIVGLLRSAALEGVVLAPPAGDHPLILRQLAQAGIVCARIAPTRLLDKAHAVVIDDVAAARAIARHVIDLGHRRIAIIRGDPSHESSVARMKGYADAFRSAGLAIDPGLVDTGFYTREGGAAAATRLLGRADPPTAILAQNDDMALGVLTVARELRFEVPEQLSIVGFDDAEFAGICWPPLTTVRQPVFDMARMAADMVIMNLEERTRNIQLRQLEFQLIVRGSTVAVPHAR